MEENKIVVTLTVRNTEDGQELNRDIVVIDGQIPEGTGHFVQEMVTLLLDNEEKF